MNYIYTVRGHKIAHIEPYNPFYQICTFLPPYTGYYFVRDALPEVDATKEFHMTYSIKEGYQVVYEPLTADDRSAINEVLQRLHVHKRWLNFSNSAKMRYIKTGYGQDVLDRFLQEELNSEEPVLFQQLAESKGTSVEIEKQNYKLYLDDVKFVFQFLISVEQKMLAKIEEGNYTEANQIIQEARKNLGG